MIFSKKDKELIFAPKVFNSINYTKNDEAINNIKINFNDDFDNLNDLQINFDFDRYINMPKFIPIDALDNISIRVPEYEDSYLTINVNPSISVLQPFTYTSIRHKNGEKYKRISRLTPSSKWPKINFDNEQKFIYKDGE